MTRWIEQSGASGQRRTEPTHLGGSSISNDFRLGDMVGRSLVMQRLFTRLQQAAMHLRIVALEGEPGTGKTLAAKTLHSLGPASGAKFVACAASRFTSTDV